MLWTGTRPRACPLFILEYNMLHLGWSVRRTAYVFIHSSNMSIQRHIRMNAIKTKESYLPKYLTLICDECSKLFSSSVGLYKHKKIVHRGECHSCHLCDQKFSLKDYLNNHFNAVHGEKKYPCNHCTYSSGYRTNLQTHINSIHKGQKFPCNVCDYEAKSRSNLNSHRKGVHGGLEFQCEKCNYRGRTIGALTKHNQCVHLKLRVYRTSLKEKRKASISIKGEI